MSRGFPCWQCGKPAPGGVCLGPHVGYDHSAAVSSQMVMNLDRQENARTYPGASIDYETTLARKAYKRRYAREVRTRWRQARFEARLRAERRLAARLEREHAA